MAQRLGMYEGEDRCVVKASDSAKSISLNHLIG